MRQSFLMGGVCCGICVGEGEVVLCVVALDDWLLVGVSNGGCDDSARIIILGRKM